MLSYEYKAGRSNVNNVLLQCMWVYYGCDVLEEKQAG